MNKDLDVETKAEEEVTNLIEEIVIATDSDAEKNKETSEGAVDEEPVNAQAVEEINAPVEEVLVEENSPLTAEVIAPVEGDAIPSVEEATVLEQCAAPAEEKDSECSSENPDTENLIAEISTEEDVQAHVEKEVIAIVEETSEGAVDEDPVNAPAVEEIHAPVEEVLVEESSPVTADVIAPVEEDVIPPVEEVNVLEQSAAPAEEKDSECSSENPDTENLIA